MKYSLSNLLLVTALIAVLLGWFYDHHRLANDKERLNGEAAGLCNMVSMLSQGSGTVIVPPDKMPAGTIVLGPGQSSVSLGRSYNFLIEEDRTAWLKDHRAPYNFSRSMYEALRY